tara:strand:+ start:357 stop:1283 length:927 start_codon:yes stop_codon:yes gene_type:complete
MEASITFKSVAKKIKKDTLLADLSFGVEKGTRFALVGTNGSGKSTILKLLSGIIEKDKGSIYVKGYDMNIKPNEIKSLIGYMCQQSDLDNSLTIYENILINGSFYNLSKKQVKDRINSLSKILNFNQFLNNFPSNLSYGQERIAMFIKTIIHDPEIILLDEPTTNIDPVFKEIIWEYIYNHLEDKTIIFTTNNFEDAQKFSHRIAILHQGIIKYNGTFDYLVENTHGLTRFLISFRNKISEQLIKNISLNPKIVDSKISENNLSFFSVDKTEYFKILKFALDSEINDIDISKCSLEDIFKKINTEDFE